MFTVLLRTRHIVWVSVCSVSALSIVLPSIPYANKCPAERNAWDRFCVCVCVLRAYVSRLPANVVCIKVNIFWFVTRLLVIGWVVIVRGSIAPALALPCACICVCVSECHMVIWHGTAVTEFPTYCNHKIKNCTIQWGREETRCATTLCIGFDVNGTTFNTHKKYIPKKKYDNCAAKPIWVMAFPRIDRTRNNRQDSHI